MGAAKDTFTAEEAVVAQRDLRHVLGLASEMFSLPAFVGMISDEIEQLRAAGYDNRQISGLIRDAIGREISPDDIQAHYASPQARGR
jgi:hypothetical protein